MTQVAEVSHKHCDLKQPLKVLIINDCEDDALLLVSHLKARGFEPSFRRVESRETLEAALEEDCWDVVLCEYVLPQLSVVETFRYVRRCDQLVPLIVVAGSVGEGELVQLVKLGAQDVVLKGNLGRLKPAIGRALAAAEEHRDNIDVDVRLVSAIESIAEGIALFDAEDRLIMCNQRYRQILDRCTASVVIGARFEDILRQAAQHGQFDEPDGDVDAVVRKRLSWHRKAEAPIEQRFSDGRWVRVEERKTAAGGIIAVLTDITERKKLDAMKSEFISVVGHELRTPLTSIKGALALLQSGATGRLAPRATAMIDIAHKNSDRLVQLINDILDLQKTEAGKMQFEFGPVAVGPLLEQAAVATEGYVNEYGVGIELRKARNDTMVMADPNRLIQVLTNLISNAIKFSPAGSKVTVRCRRRKDWVRVSVSDRGPGIPSRFHDLIFQKFSQVDSSASRKSGGSGLGLSIAKAIVESHGGTIGFDSAEGEGTTFYFDLPRWNPGHASRAAGRHPRRPKLLICDDDAGVRGLLTKLVADLGCDAVTCATVAQARRMVSEGGIVAITLDIALPDRAGLRLIDELRQNPETEHIPIIIVSSKGERGKSMPSVGAIKIVDWLEKPIDCRRFKRGVERTISGNRRPRILHVEDDEDHRQIVSQLIDGLGKVDTAKGCGEARKRLKATSYDLVILDLLLPDAGGESLLSLIYAKGETAPPVLIFSVKEVPQSILASTAGALVKSKVSNEALKLQIKQLLTGARVREDVTLFANQRMSGQ